MRHLSLSKNINIKSIACILNQSLNNFEKIFEGTLYGQKAWSFNNVLSKSINSFNFLLIIIDADPSGVNFNEVQNIQSVKSLLINISGGAVATQHVTLRITSTHYITAGVQFPTTSTFNFIQREAIGTTNASIKVFGIF